MVWGDRKNQYPHSLTILRRKAEADLMRDDGGKVDWNELANYETQFAGWGRILSQTGRELFLAKQTHSEVTMGVVVPSCSETRTVDGTHRVVYEGRTFEVISSYDREERHDEVVLLCAERRD